MDARSAPRRRWPRPVTGSIAVIAGFVVAGLLLFDLRAVQDRARTWLLIALLVGLAAYLLRRLPLSALIVLLTGLVVLATAGRDTAAGLLLALGSDLAVAWLAMHRSSRVSIAGAALAVLGQIGSLRIGPSAASGGSALLIILGVVTAWMIGGSIRERRRHAEAIRVEAQARAVSAERLLIARDVHDLVAHSISMIAIQAGVGRRVIETQPAEAAKALEAIENASRQTLAELRRTVGALRQAESTAPAGATAGATAGGTAGATTGAPAEAGGPAGAPAPREPARGLADLDRLAASARAAGVRVDVRRFGRERPLPPDLDVSAFRIVQESVTNVIRHAGTDACQVTVDYRDDELCLEITDEGRDGTPPPGSGFGIIGMRERVSLLHGHFEAGPRPGGGFAVTARLPLPVVAG